MSSKRGRDAEDAKRRKLARQRFRGLVRSVIFNKTWLNDIGDQKLSLNVKKNIAMLVRTQRKIGMLTLAEKSLLRTHPYYRTLEDRKKLTSFIASLTCFSRFPPKVRARLAPVVKFLYVNRGRQLMKEGDIPMTLYFILTGEVEISTRVYDPVKNDYVEKPELISGSGDCLGEVELIENILRKNTYTVTSDVELLVVFDDDFDRILRPIMSAQWYEKKIAIATLDYFNFFTNDQIITACKLGMLRQFEALETIYYEDKGQASYVYFVLSGECMILQCLKIREAEKHGNKTFDLVDISQDDTAAMFQELTNADFMHRLREDQATQYKDTLDIDQEILSVDSTAAEDQRQKGLQKMDIKGIEISCGLLKGSHTSVVGDAAADETGREGNVKFAVQKDGSSLRADEEDNQSEMFYEEGESEEEELSEEASGIGDTKSDTSLVASKTRISLDQPEDAGATEQSRRTSDDDGDAASKAIENSLNKEAEIGDSVPMEEAADGKELAADREEHKGDDEEGNPSGMTTFQASFTELHQPKNSKVENHFIDVGSVTFNGIFGLGEKLEHRVIMARTTVQCLMMPRFWLFERDQNPGNVWQRRRFYLDCTIPSRQKLFKDFLSTRKWQKFKKDIIESNLNLNATNNPTKVQDIPIICRIVETHD